MGGRDALFVEALAAGAFAVLVGCGSLASTETATDAGRDAPTCDGGWKGLGPGGSQDVWPLGAMRVDETDVYWVGDHGNAPPGFLLRTPESGGATATLASPCDPSFTLDEARIYFTVSGSGADATTLYALSKAGGTRTVLATGLPSMASLVVDDAAIYFAGNGKIERVPKTGGAISVLSDAPTSSCPTGSLCRPPAVFGVDEESVYFTALSDAAGVTDLLSTSKATGAVTHLATLATNTVASILGSHEIYVAAFERGWSVVSIPKGGGPTATLAKGVGGLDLATDGRSLFTDGPSVSGQTVVSVPMSGGSPTEVARAPFGVGGIAVDAAFLYWLDYQELGANLERSCK